MTPHADGRKPEPTKLYFAPPAPLGTIRIIAAHMETAQGIVHFDATICEACNNVPTVNAETNAWTRCESCGGTGHVFTIREVTT